jgi:subtilisin-like proprotein convertase family protein
MVGAVRRRSFALAALLVLVPVLTGSTRAATRTYSTGPVQKRLPAGGVLRSGVNVPDSGPVSHVSVSVRIDTARAAGLSLTLISPAGTEVELSARRGGTGANYGSGPGCSGGVTFEDGFDSLKGAQAPLVGTYAPEQHLSRLDGQQARGRWKLRISADTPGTAATLRCWQIEVSRDVVEHVTARSGAVSADLSYRESDFDYRDINVTVRRADHVALHAPLSRFACRGCPSSGFNAITPRPLTIRDLDGDGEPEVLVDVYTGGAHCCFYTAILRYLGGTYRGKTVFWGDPGYSVERLDGQVVLVSADDHFAYEFTSYAASGLPIQIWRYDRGKLTDVTSELPALVRRDAAMWWGSYLGARRQKEDVRGVLAAWLADEYRLGLGDEGWKQVRAAFARGEVSAPRVDPLWPAGRHYLDALRRFLVERGYATP